MLTSPLYHFFPFKPIKNIFFSEIQKKILERNETLYLHFISFKSHMIRASSDTIWYCLRKKVMPEKSYNDSINAQPS